MSDAVNECQREDDAFAAYIDFAISLQDLMGDQEAKAYLTSCGVPDAVIERVLHPEGDATRRVPKQSIGPL